MGNCVLVRSEQKSVAKFKWSVGSETVVNVPSEPKKAIVWEKEIGRLCSSPLSSPMNHVPCSPDFSKGDEMFFDSQAWLDSDNEDFFSVNGDNTPSCGSTPIWRPNSNGVETPPAEPSPKEGKKLLIELFRDSFNSEQGRSSIANTSNRRVELVNTEAKANNKKPILKRRWRSAKGKSAQSTPCCLPVPNLARSLSLGDKKKRLLRSPCHGGG